MILIILLVLITIGTGIVRLCYNRCTNKSEKIQDTPYQFYASLGGWELPPEGFSVNRVRRSEMPHHADNQVGRIRYFLDLVND